MHSIELRGACTHNLRGVDIDLLPGTMTVLCGPSGAGKSSLAFGTLYAEGQRRYVESFSAYARQFLERLARPDLSSLRFMPAAIAVDRGGQVKTSRSTVATLTELADGLKQLWALCAEQECVHCGGRVVAHSAETAVTALLTRMREQPVVVTYPLALASEEEFLGVRDGLIRDGYRRVLISGEIRDLDQVPPSQVFGEARGKRRKPPREAPTLYVIADRTTTRSEDRTRLVAAVETAFERGSGTVRVASGTLPPVELSRELRCERCGERARRPSPGMFSFNSPIGACDTCRGFGRTIGVDWDKVFGDRQKSLQQGAIRPWSGKSAKHERKLLLRHCQKQGIPTDVPIAELHAEQIATLIEGDGGGWRNGYPGLRRWFAWLETRAYKMHVRVLLSRYRSYDTCKTCNGMRFRREVLAFQIDGVTLPALYAMEVKAAAKFIDSLSERARADQALLRALDECRVRLSTLRDVGLGYLTLDRSSRSLSGGELQRVTLTSALDSRLTGTLFVLDEPTVGLHPKDVTRLLPVVRQLTRADNIVLVVESDEHFLQESDRVVELGPGAGEAGGRIVFDGPPEALLRAQTATGSWLREGNTRRTQHRPATCDFLALRGASGHNLRGVDLSVPLGRFTCVTGVSGSGKSSLILQTLVPAVLRALGDSLATPLAHRELLGADSLRDVVFVDQTPLGRTSRGNPATYLGIWDALRKRFAATKLARERGYKPGMFSANVAGGRCEACKGEGAETIEMQFLADVRFDCPECAGKRFVGPVLDVTLAGKNVAEALELTALEATIAFAAFPDVQEKLSPLIAVGASYLRLGQPLCTLSGGEAQRLKLASALLDARPGLLLVLDEPTVGLHGKDIAPLLACLNRLVDLGSTVIVVEHDMRVAAQADHVIDLGPGAGEAGGSIVAFGTPEQVSECGESATAPYLRAALLGGSASAAQRFSEPRVKAGSDASKMTVRGAREHNLKGIDVDIPRDQLVVVTGPSGSGKSTLAFDVVFAESQRRYLDTLSPYVRQYLKQLPRPHVDHVDGVPPGVSLEQRQTAGAKNSTVATVTEVAHYLRLLYARVGLLHCPECRVAIAPRSLEALWTHVRHDFAGNTLSVFAPVVRGKKGAHRELLTKARADGVRRVRIDGVLRELVPRMSLDRYKEHDVELFLGSISAEDRALRELLERALLQGDGAVRIMAKGREQLLSSKRACAQCGRGFPELDPRFFSFNTRQGACSACEGKGVADDVETEGQAPLPCATCGGRRLSGLALHTTVDGMAIADLMAQSVDAALVRVRAINLEGRARELGKAPLAEIAERLGFLGRVGLGYLSLDRAAHTLSGGEMQRVRLAGQLGSGLTGVLYVLDEPTIGLHPRDTGRLLTALTGLVTQGCSVLVVEHDADVIRSADHLIDIGPAGGHDGGRVVAEGRPEVLLGDPASVTGRALAAQAALPVQRRPIGNVPTIDLHGAREHNLKGIAISIPVGRFVAVTGVSGSGKSTLVREVFLRAVRKALGLVTEPAGLHQGIAGVQAIKRAVEIDQSPIGRTPRSVPATYLGIWDEIRGLYARTPEARARGYKSSRFSFNVAAGRCAECEGQGALRVEMSFLPDALLPCEGCGGMRYNPETLAVMLHGTSIGQLLESHIDEVEKTLSAFPAIHRSLSLMCELGLGYLKLGQPSNTLSGGEAQRLKLVSELSSATSASTLYVMDEPTTGLHREDVMRLLRVLDRLVDRGDTVVVIEHQPDLILRADWVIDLGPEGGDQGGRIVAQGTPEQIMKVKSSHTGAALKRTLAYGQPANRTKQDASSPTSSR